MSSSETPLRSTSSEGTKQPDGISPWGLSRYAAGDRGTVYITFKGKWYATVNSENAEKLLELLKQTR
jgi:hypothetical protein